MSKRWILLSLFLPWACSCRSVVGPSCLARQERGPVASVSGDVNPDDVAVHEVPYGTQGSQNDVKVAWTGQFASGGPRIRVYATRLDCVDFAPPPNLGANNGTGACANLGTWGGVLSPDARPCAASHTCEPQDSDLVQTSLIIPNGRGNPDVLGPSARYKLWVVGDRSHSTSYTISTTFFYGPDC